MEYIDLVNRIVAAEHSAKEISREVKAQETTITADLEQETIAMREAYFTRAKRRVAQVEATEAQASEEYIAIWDKKLSEAMKAVETSYEKNEECWVETLFSMIVGGQA